MSSYDPQELEDLMQFAHTERQREILESVITHGTREAAAAAMGLTDPTSISSAIGRIKAWAAKKGWSPGHDLNHPLADGQALKGTSTLYKRNEETGEDEQVLQWVKTTADQERQLEIMRETAEAMSRDLEPIKRIEPAGGGNDNLMNFYPLSDCHIGMLSWPDETGAIWDLKEAERVICGSWEHAIFNSPPATHGTIALMGDWLHWDSSIAAVTPMSGHNLDADSRFPRVVRVAVRMIRRCIEQALRKHEHVDLVLLEGNHDPTSTVWMRIMFSELYAKSEHLFVDQTIAPYWSSTFGKTFLGGTHGHVKGDQGAQGAELALNFADSLEWGQTRHRYIHTGHKHSRMIRELPGVTIERHRTMAAPDAYAVRGGWKSRRGMRAITYHRDYGEVSGQEIIPEMVA